MLISPPHRPQFNKRSAPNPASSPLFAGKKLVALDFDSTVTSDTEHVKTAIEDASSDHIILINTQRGLQGMEPLRAFLGRNVHYIAGGDGTQFYANQDARRSTDSFVRKLHHGKQPNDWLKTQKEKTNWDHRQVMKIVDRLLSKEAPKLIEKHSTPTPNPENSANNGQKPGKPQPLIQLKRYMPDEPAFELKAEAKDKEALKACGKELCDQLQQALAAQKIKATINLQYASDKTLKYGIVPEGYDKTAPIKYIIDHHPGGIDEVISAGDGMNDVPVLKHNYLFQRNNLALVCGSNPSVKKALGENKHIKYLADQGLHLGSVLRALISRPSNIRFQVEQNGRDSFRHKISGHEFFSHYDKLNRAQKLKYWEMISGLIQNKDSTVKIDSRGTTYIYTKRPDGDARIRGLTPENNPLITVARDEQKWDRRYSNGRFVVVKDLKHNFNQPHFLILPKPLKPWQSGNYANLAHFLKEATDDQKVHLLDTMAQLVNSSPKQLPDINCLFRINSGRFQEIPYLHIHYTPFQRDFEKPGQR